MFAASLPRVCFCFINRRHKLACLASAAAHPPSCQPENAGFLQRLARFFQRDFMTWVNQPPCAACQGKNVKYQCTRGPETSEEKQGGASRVEVYQCQDCADETTTTFPRYNVPRKLLETRRGRCGEYANLFGCMCRAVGFDARYISDFTDHVWTEVRVVHEGVEQWIMVDSCEGVVNEPSVSVLEQSDIRMKKNKIHWRVTDDSNCRGLYFY